MKEEIVIYWWNMGKKQLDYKGTYDDYLKEKGISAEEISPPARKGWRFKIPLVGCSATLDIFENYRQGCNEAIRIFLTLLGDRALFYTPSRKYCINWNG